MPRGNSVRVRSRCISANEGCKVSELWLKLRIRCAQDKVAANLDDNYKAYLLPFVINLPKLKLRLNSQRITAQEMLKIPFSDIQDARLFAPIEYSWKLISEGYQAVSPHNKAILAKIAQARDKGIAQTQLASACKLDAKDVYRFLKPLLAFGIVSKMPVTVAKQATNQLFHRRFLAYSGLYQQHISLFESLSKVEDLQSALNIDELPKLSTSNITRINYDLNKRKVSVILNTAKNQTLLSKDLMTALQIDISTKTHRKAFYKLLSEMYDGKYIEYIQIPKVNLNGSHGFYKCVRFVESYPRPDEKTEKIDTVTDSFIEIDSTLDAQIFKIVTDAGVNGITGKSLNKALSNISVKLLSTPLSRLTNISKSKTKKKKGKVQDMPIIAQYENEGRARQYRYYAAHILDNPTPKASNILSTAQSLFTDVPATSNLQADLGEIPQPEVKEAQVEPNLSPVSSVTASNRRIIIMKLLESDPIRIFDKSFIEEIQNGVASAYTIDRRTMNRDIEYLHNQKELIRHDISIYRSNGARVNKSIVIGGGYTLDSPQVESFLKEMRDDLLFKMPVSKVTKIEEVVEFERLTNTKEDSEDLADKVDSEERDPTHVDLFTERPKDIQIEYGYLSGRCVRLRVFHDWIVDLVRKENIPKWGRPGHTIFEFRTASLFSKLTVYMYLQIIGFNNRSEVLDSFLKNHGSGDVELGNLEPEIKSLLLGNYRLRPAITLYLELFHLMGLIDPTDPEEWKNQRQNTTLNLRYTIPVLDFTVDPPTFLRGHDLRIESSVTEFWTALEYRCVAIITSGGRLSKKGLARSKSADPLGRNQMTRVEIPEQFFFLFHSSNWITLTKFTEVEKQILNSYITRQAIPQSRLTTIITPLLNEFLCQQVSEQSGLKITRVMLYYQKIEHNFRNRQDRMIKRQMQDDLSENIKLNRSSRVPKLGRRCRFNHTIISKLHEISGNSLAPRDGIARRKIWTIVDDQKLVYIITVCQGFEIRGIEAWKRLAPAVLDRVRQNIGKRFKLINETKQFKEFSDLARQVWPRVLHKKLEMDQLPSDFLNVDNLEKYLTELIEILKEEVEEVHFNAGTLNIPKQIIPEVTYLYDLDTILLDHKLDRSYPCIDLLSKLENVMSRSSQMTILTSVTMYTDSDSIVQVFSNEELSLEIIEMEKIKSLIKIILLAPDDIHNPAQSFLVLKQFSSDLVDAAFNQLQKQNIIVKCGKGFEKKVPGRSIQLSDRFLAVLKGPFADEIIPRALRYLKQLRLESDSIPMPLELDCGMMLVYLESMAAKKLELNPILLSTDAPTSFDDNCKLADKIHIMITPKLQQLKRALDDKVDKMGKKRAHEEDSNLLNIVSIDSNEFELDQETKQSITDAILDSKELGIELTTLSETILDPSPYLKALLSEEKIILTGFQSPRYVSKVYENTWNLEVHDDLFTAQTSSNQTRMQWITPKIWIGINGVEVIAVKRACMEILISQIVDKPGIYQTKLEYLVSSAMTPVEVHEILDILVERGCCTRKHYRKSRPYSILDGLFDNARFDTEETIETRSEMTAYHAQPQWYELCSASFTT